MEVLEGRCDVAPSLMPSPHADQRAHRPPDRAGVRRRQAGRPPRPQPDNVPRHARDRWRQRVKISTSHRQLGGTGTSTRAHHGMSLLGTLRTCPRAVPGSVDRSRADIYSLGCILYEMRRRPNFMARASGTARRAHRPAGTREFHRPPVDWGSAIILRRSTRSNADKVEELSPRVDRRRARAPPSSPPNSRMTPATGRP